MHPDNTQVLAKDEQLNQLLKPLNKFLAMREVTELTINKPTEVWTKSPIGWTQHAAPELTMNYLTALATAMIVYNNLQPAPIVSVTLPNGERGQIVMPPACIAGTLSMAIRKHSMIVKTLEELDDAGMFANFIDVSPHKLTEQQLTEYAFQQDLTKLQELEIELLKLKEQKLIKQFLGQAVLNKRNIMIAGKTGSGKTTFARSLIKKVPVNERLITIEDVHELYLDDHPNKVHMLYGSNDARVSASDCLESCMRQSPDRIFLAELRGDEAWEYLNSLNTGHPGSITTIHANSALQTFERLATLIKKTQVGLQIDLPTIKSVLYSTIDIVLFVQDFQLTELFYDPIFAMSKIS